MSMVENSAAPLVLHPVGVFKTAARYKYEQPRQGTCESAGVGEVILDGGSNFEQALEDLSGFERIWLVYHFHQNSDSWRTKAAPPVPPSGKNRVGLFASRSPYRPNPIGLSCVRLVSIQKRILTVSEADLLDGTPILDIKPYIPAFDAFPEARSGWLEEQVREEYNVDTAVLFREKGSWLKEHAALDPESFARVQLSINPFDRMRKRVIMDTDGSGVLSYRTWRIMFYSDTAARKIIITDLYSGYDPKDLAGGAADPHGDIQTHRNFLKRYPWNACEPGTSAEEGDGNG